MSLALIYKIKNKGYLIFGSVQTETGLNIGTDPFIRIAETEINANTIANAIKSALDQDDDKIIPHPKDWNEVSKEFLRKSGLKSSKELHKESSMLCNVEKKDSSLIFIPLIHAENLNEGYVNVEKNRDVNVIISDNASDLEIFDALELAFNRVN